ncbi:MAG: aspartate aminotransferase family protein [Actinobacteria bacterium]|nr:aspartate aminotransferase family protein [Actinomycetota bacterium]
MNGLKNIEIYEKGNNYLMATYTRYPVVFTKARMQYLWDSGNRKYLDFIAGYGCLNVGHSNKSVVNALKKQIGKIMQPSNVFFNQPQVELARKLCEISGFGQKVFFANSGAESIEAAIKLARKYSVDKYGISRYEVITFNRSFHGRTLGALAATAQPVKQRMFEPLLEGFKYADLNNKDSVQEKICDKTCAIMLEPVQGEGGIYPADADFLKWLEGICRGRDILLILDEVQTGFGRTGKMFAFQNFDIIPDILVVAKSLGGGMPAGAMISTDRISKSFSPGIHGSTFGGNAASSSAGIAVIDYILKHDLPGRAKELGSYFMGKLERLKEKYPLVREVRGMGLMIAIELNKPLADEIVRSALKDGLVLNKVSDSTLRFLPPLVIKKSHIDILLRWLNNKIRELD